MVAYHENIKSEHKYFFWCHLSFLSHHIVFTWSIHIRYCQQDVGIKSILWNRSLLWMLRRINCTYARASLTLKYKISICTSLIALLLYWSWNLKMHNQNAVLNVHRICKILSLIIYIYFACKCACILQLQIILKT